MQNSLEAIQQRIRDASLKAARPFLPRLVAVSKFKSVEEIKEAYQLGLRVFGENRIDELKSKSTQLPRDIEWHFIGNIQSNKINTLLSIPNLSVIETVDSLEHAKKLNGTLTTNYPGRILAVFIQINTSGEGTKHGFNPEEALESIKWIQEECKALDVKGLMTIGSVRNSIKAGLEDGSNPDFESLLSLRNQLGNPELELSMGMSTDFETAVLSYAYLLSGIKVYR